MDSEYLDKIKNFFQDHKRMPSYSEIAKAIGFKSKDSVRKLVNRLIKAGHIEKDKIGKIIPKNLFNELLFVRNYVEAGTGWISPAEEELRDTINLDQYLIGNREATVSVPIKGDSMIGAGILPGDIVLAERGAISKDGDLVIARVDSKYVLKRFRKEAEKVWLESANPKFKPIYPKEELVIVAVVKGLVRKY